MSIEILDKLLKQPVNNPIYRSGPRMHLNYGFIVTYRNSKTQESGQIIDRTDQLIIVKNEYDKNAKEIELAQIDFRCVNVQFYYKNRKYYYRGKLSTELWIQIIRDKVRTNIYLFWNRITPNKSFAIHDRYRVLKIVSEMVTHYDYVYISSGSIIDYIFETHWRIGSGIFAERKRIETILDSLVESGELRLNREKEINQEALYILQGKGLVSLEKYELEEKYNRKTLKLQWYIVMLTVCVALQAVVYCINEYPWKAPTPQNIRIVQRESELKQSIEKLTEALNRLSSVPGPELPGGTAVRQRDPEEPERAVRTDQAVDVPGKDSAGASPAEPAAINRPAVVNATEPIPGFETRPTKLEPSGAKEIEPPSASPMKDHKSTLKESPKSNPPPTVKQTVSEPAKIDAPDPMPEKPVYPKEAMVKPDAGANQNGRKDDSLMIGGEIATSPSQIGLAGCTAKPLKEVELR